MMQQIEQMRTSPDPRHQQIYKMVAGKSPTEIEQLAKNLYSSSGKSYSAFESQIKNTMRNIR